MTLANEIPGPWRKSSYSAKIEGCVEVARARDVVAVRDSKDPDGPALTVSPAAFARFVRSLRDLP